MNAVASSRFQALLKLLILKSLEYDGFVIFNDINVLPLFVISFFWDYAKNSGPLETLGGIETNRYSIRISEKRKGGTKLLFVARRQTRFWKRAAPRLA